MRLCLKGFAQHIGVHKVENNVKARAHLLGVKRSRLGSEMSLGVSGRRCKPHHNGNNINSLKGWEGKQALES